MVGVEEPNGCNHGGVAVPVAVLVVRKKMQKVLFVTSMREIRTGARRRNERNTLQTRRFSGHGYGDTCYLNENRRDNSKTRANQNIVIRN